jgi:hypothetical protein
LVVFVVEPEQVSLCGFTVLCHPDRHGVFGGFSETGSLAGDDLLVVESTLVDLFLVLQLLLVVGDYFELFHQLFGYVRYLEYFW